MRAIKMMFRQHRLHRYGHSQANGKYPMGIRFNVSPVHKHLGTAFGTMMWLWIFWRAKNDGRVVLGLEHPWDHGHSHSDHSEAAEADD